MARCGKIEYGCGEVIVRNRGRIPVGCANHRRGVYPLPLMRGVVAFGNGNHGGGNAVKDTKEET